MPPVPMYMEKTLHFMHKKDFLPGPGPGRALRLDNQRQKNA